MATALAVRETPIRRLLARLTTSKKPSQALSFEKAPEWEWVALPSDVPYYRSTKDMWRASSSTLRIK